MSGTTVTGPEPEPEPEPEPPTRLVGGQLRRQRGRGLIDYTRSAAWSDLGGNAATPRVDREEDVDGERCSSVRNQNGGAELCTARTPRLRDQGGTPFGRSGVGPHSENLRIHAAQIMTRDRAVTVVKIHRLGLSAQESHLLAACNGRDCISVSDPDATQPQFMFDQVGDAVTSTARVISGSSRVAP
jgi:hypothetical protein